MARRPPYPEPSDATYDPGPFVYKMIQMPVGIVLGKRERGDEMASALERIVNAEAARGWEFYSLDSFAIVLKPGCIGSLLGLPSGTRTDYVVIFRRPR